MTAVAVESVGTAGNRSMDSLVELVEVDKRYGTVAALSGVSVRVGAGELFGLLGPDGAGKTTAIRLMCGLLHPDRGQLRILGLDPVAAHRTVVRSLGYLSQRFGLYGDLSVDENLAFFARLHGVSEFETRRDRLLEVTSMTRFRHRLVDQLSGGMRQKLALACTLVHEPVLLLLDEATTGVDPVSRREFWKLLAEFRRHGITIVMTTPYLDEAERCTRVALLHDGRLLAVDDPSRLRASHPWRVFEVVARPRHRVSEVLAQVPGVVGVAAFGARAHVQVRPNEVGPEDTRLIRALRESGVTVDGVRQVPASLEDVFIDRIGAVG